MSTKHIIGHIGDDFYRSDDLTNIIIVIIRTFVTR